ncbi:hypothetical protein GOP47_0019329 [Adiantum capillus-veneris]|uniref:Uncharacterized protein n=1 Tax=Adiantum capillus-veneris TaxID=13818 RepID=A0A9D4UF74_ADICA|nr:hypothetical protein GOP47_0019329 [Adiantum capillus-veneris]
MPLYSRYPTPQATQNHTHTHTLFANLYTMDSSMSNHNYPHSHMSTSAINPPTNDRIPTPLDAYNFPTCKCTHTGRRHTSKPPPRLRSHNLSPSLFAHTHILSGAAATTDFGKRQDEE